MSFLRSIQFLLLGQMVGLVIFVSLMLTFFILGAIIHYKPKKDSCGRLGFDSLYLCDSGGQYVDGTTDVTRTLHFGEPTQRMRDCFTYVLKVFVHSLFILFTKSQQSHIALAQVVFPEGVLGSRLDPIARAPLWSVGLDYNHGTGHGVGGLSSS